VNVSRLAELRRIQMRLVTHPPSTVRAARRIQKRCDVLYQEAVSDSHEVSRACAAFEVQIKKLIRRCKVTA
jgi:hypothetical protein